MTHDESLKSINLVAYHRIEAEARLRRAEAMAEMAIAAGRSIRRLAAGACGATVNAARRLRVLIAKPVHG